MAKKESARSYKSTLHRIRKPSLADAIESSELHLHEGPCKSSKWAQNGSIWRSDAVKQPS